MTDQHMYDYPTPLNRLLTYGDCRSQPAWPNYLTLGLGPEHTSDLIRMALDEDLHAAPSDSPQVWAPIHAWRTLGQLHAVAAVAPLLGLLHRIDDNDDDWAAEDLPRALGLIGPTAITPLAAYLADEQHGLYARIAASRALQHIAAGQPAARSEIVNILVRQLECGPANGPQLNGLLISGLLDLHATGAAPVMEQVFAAGQVDLVVAGDWEDVQIELGLKDRRDTPRRNYLRDSLGLSRLPLLGAEKEDDEVESRAPIEADTPQQKSGSTAKKDKARRKQAKLSRRKNRKKR